MGPGAVDTGKGQDCGGSCITSKPGIKPGAASVLDCLCGLASADETFKIGLKSALRFEPQQKERGTPAHRHCRARKWLLLNETVRGRGACMQRAVLYRYRL